MQFFLYKSKIIYSLNIAVFDEYLSNIIMSDYVDIKWFYWLNKINFAHISTFK